METLEEEMILAPGACGNDSTILLRTVPSLRYRNCFFLEFPIKYFQTTVDLK